MSRLVVMVVTCAMAMLVAIGVGSAIARTNSPGGVVVQENGRVLFGTEYVNATGVLDIVNPQSCRPYGAGYRCYLDWEQTRTFVVLRVTTPAIRTTGGAR